MRRHTTSVHASPAERQMEGLVAVARALGRVCKDHFAATAAELVQLAREAAHPLRQVLRFVLELRVARRRDVVWQDVLRWVVAESGSVAPPRWFMLFLRDAFAMYCAMRRAAAPRAEQPAFEPRTALPVGRAVSRQLRAYGVHVAHSPRWVLVRRAEARLRHLWRGLRGGSAVLWFDNFYKPRYVYNPLRSHATLNATVMAVMGVVAVPRGFRWPGVEELDACARRVEEWVHRESRVVAAVLSRVSGLDMLPHQFRVPLDVPRRAVRALPWRPLSLNDDIVQTQELLLKTLQFCQRLSRHVTPPLPLLVDENIAYRIQKLCYAEPMQRWDVRGSLRTTPVLYGVWHPYKYVLTLVHRRFIALFEFLRRGTAPVGQGVNSSPKLRSLEQWLGAMLLVPLADRQSVSALVARLRRELVVVDQHIHDLVRQMPGRHGVLGALQPVVEQVLGRDVSPWDFTDVRDHVPQYAAVRAQRAREVQRQLRDAWRARGVLQDRLTCATGMDVLLNDYAPMCLILGSGVRSCTWELVANHTGAEARRVLVRCLLVLMRLNEGREVAVEYVRTVCVALLLWTDWHDEVPAAWFCEETCEAALSRLSSLCHRHTQHVSTQEIHDLWMQVKPGSQLPHNLPVGGVPRQLQHTVTDMVRAFVRQRGDGVTPLVWQPQGPFRLSHTVKEWPAKYAFPASLRWRPVLPAIRSVVVESRQRLHQQSKPSATLEAAMDAMFPVRDELEAALDVSLMIHSRRRRGRPSQH